jgi:hypothetical protein
MATGRSSFAKRQRDMAKKAKALAKRQRRLERGDGETDEDDVDEETPVASGPQLSNDQVMEKVADLHRRYDDGQMDLDTFDEEKALLMAQISVD